MQAIIVGGDTIACCIADRLLHERHGVSIIEEDPRRAEELAMRYPSALVVCGAGTDSVSLTHARAADADVIFALAGSDSANIVTCLLSERLFGIRNRLALSACARNDIAFRALDIECICGPESVATALIERIPARKTSSLA